ncbi:recombinase family protein, partial [Brevundimonas sp.]|uniref:recombinase family protein n=1 Tax=Brevundimonas sp. TaxID=1871086 RepID=UPI003784C713
MRLDGRVSLQHLIADVQNGQTEFDVILVYGVSRWGRFQDADESAYYEFICREAGIAVHYCAEQFENDGSLSATIIKSMTRAMAGEYSRGCCQSNGNSSPLRGVRAGEARTMRRTSATRPGRPS